MLTTFRLPLLPAIRCLLRDNPNHIGFEVDVFFEQPAEFIRSQSGETRDLDDACAHNLSLLAHAGIHVTQIHRISARQAFRGDTEGSGVAALLSEINSFLSANKGRVLSDRFRARVTAAASTVAQALELTVSASRKSVDELDTELASLRQSKQNLIRRRELVEQAFGPAS